MGRIYLSSRDEGDLFWYWNEAESELGLSSTQGKLLQKIQEGRVSDHHAIFDINDARIHAASRFRVIRDRLAPLSRTHFATLHARYGPGPPREVAQRFHALHTVALPIALLLLVAKRSKVTAKQLASWMQPATGFAETAQRHLSDLRLQAVLALSQASAAYAATPMPEEDDT